MCNWYWMMKMLAMMMKIIVEERLLKWWLWHNALMKEIIEYWLVKLGFALNQVDVEQEAPVGVPFKPCFGAPPTTTPSFEGRAGIKVVVRKILKWGRQFFAVGYYNLRCKRILWNFRGGTKFEVENREASDSITKVFGGSFGKKNT